MEDDGTEQHEGEAQLIGCSSNGPVVIVDTITAIRRIYQQATMRSVPTHADSNANPNTNPNAEHRPSKGAYTHTPTYNAHANIDATPNRRNELLIWVLRNEEVMGTDTEDWVCWVLENLALGLDSSA